jgi:hypothetical protein
MATWHAEYSVLINARSFVSAARQHFTSRFNEIPKGGIVRQNSIPAGCASCLMILDARTEIQIPRFVLRADFQYFRVRYSRIVRATNVNTSGSIANGPRPKEWNPNAH